MRNKGFTLIELLAVIVILAIIALIATPIVLGIINDSRKSADDETTKLISSNFGFAYQSAYMTNSGVEPTLNEVMAKFNMDNITVTPEPSSSNTGEYTITSSSKNVVCTTTTTGIRVKLTCTVNNEPFDEADNEITIKAN